MDRWISPLSSVHRNRARIDINVSRPITRRVSARMGTRPRVLPLVLPFFLSPALPPSLLPPLSFLFHRHRVPRIYALFYNGVVKLSALITLVDKRALSSRGRISERALDTGAYGEVMGPPGVLACHALHLLLPFPYLET